MVNAWSLAYSVLNGTLDEDYPIMYGPDDEANLKAWKEEQLKQGKPMTDDATGITEYPPDYMYNPGSFNTFSDNDDQIAHHVEGGMGYDELNLNIEDSTKENMSSDYRYKYHEDEILSDIKEYVSSTYNGHYTGNKFEFRNVQTIDLMASRDLASDFCQANILKYGSRYGSKDGKNKKDLLKVIHYGIIALHNHDIMKKGEQ